VSHKGRDLQKKPQKNTSSHLRKNQKHQKQETTTPKAKSIT